jgi:hypothetical protein
MSEIVASAEQASIIASAEGPVPIRASDGSLIGLIWPMTGFITPSKSPFTAEEIAAAKQAAANSPGPWRTTKEVLERLQSIERSES